LAYLIRKQQLERPRHSPEKIAKIKARNEAVINEILSGTEQSESEVSNANYES